jgi:hypothetical protein
VWSEPGGDRPALRPGFFQVSTVLPIGSADAKRVWNMHLEVRSGPTSGRSSLRGSAGRVWRFPPGRAGPNRNSGFFLICSQVFRPAALKKFARLVTYLQHSVWPSRWRTSQ